MARREAPAHEIANQTRRLLIMTATRWDSAEVAADDPHTAAQVLSNKGFAVTGVVFFRPAGAGQGCGGA